MDLAKMNPWNWFKKEDEQDRTLPARFVKYGPRAHSSMHPLQALQRDMDELFDETLRGFGLFEPLRSRTTADTLREVLIKPKVDITGTEKEYVVTAEMPGVAQKDIEMEVKGDTLYLKAQKICEMKSEDRGVYRSERSYGSFQRVLSLPEDADAENVKAEYKNGVVSITFPRKTVHKDLVKQITFE